MSIELATQFQPHTDEQFKAESKKALLTNTDFDWTGARSIKLYKVTTAPMNDYNRSGENNGNWSRYGAVAGLDATTEELTLKKDRSFTFAIDQLDEDETKSQLAAASALARQTREVVIPEVDSYTYGVMAAMVNFDSEGYLAIATQVAREHRDDALREIYYEIERLRQEIMSEDELQMVKNMMIGEILRILDGPFGIADVTIENIMCGMDNSATEESVARIFAITAEEIKALAEKYLRREDLIEVYAG